MSDSPVLQGNRAIVTGASDGTLWIDPVLTAGSSGGVPQPVEIDVESADPSFE
jgi:hypothetical protein